MQFFAFCVSQECRDKGGQWCRACPERSIGAAGVAADERHGGLLQWQCADSDSGIPGDRAPLSRVACDDFRGSSQDFAVSSLWEMQQFSERDSVGDHRFGQWRTALSIYGMRWFSSYGRTSLLRTFDTYCRVNSVSPHGRDAHGTGVLSVCSAPGPHPPLSPGRHEVDTKRKNGGRSAESRSFPPRSADDAAVETVRCGARG